MLFETRISLLDWCVVTLGCGRLFLVPYINGEAGVGFHWQEERKVRGKIQKHASINKIHFSDVSSRMQ